MEAIDGNGAVRRWGGQAMGRSGDGAGGAAHTFVVVMQQRAAMALEPHKGSLQKTENIAR
jgi:hypothetical protein